MSPLQELLPILTCPDDHGALRESGDGLECAGCGRRFPVLAPNLVELLPRVEALRDDGSAYSADYLA